jgi:ketosteroid isomerase-like protein
MANPPVTYPPGGGLVPELPYRCAPLARVGVAKTVLAGLKSLKARALFTHAARGGIVRTRFMLAAWAVCAACRGQTGPAFTGESLLAPLPEAEAAHDELLNADITRGDVVRRRGLSQGFADAFADDAVFLRGGLPILRGNPAIRAVVAAESASAGTAIRWQPVRAEVSRDRASGFTYGYAVLGNTGQASSLRVDRYIAFWRKGAAGWRIVGYAETYGAPPGPSAVPAAAVEGMLADVAMSSTRSAVDPIRAADVAFAREAERLGAGEAFGRYAAPDAQMFSAAGEFITGPQAISASFGPAVANSSFTWQPVYGEISSSGDLGFTVGNAVVTLERQDGAAVVRYSKYLTVWKRQQDGTWKYVVDGGNSRPSPKLLKPNP